MPERLIANRYRLIEVLGRGGSRLLAVGCEDKTVRLWCDVEI